MTPGQTDNAAGGGEGDGPFLSVVIPAHNESVRLPRAIERLGAFLGAQGYEWEILICENGSVDGTVETALSLAAGREGVRVLRDPRRGKGRAVRAGMLAARGQFRLMCDADLSMPPEEIPKFLPPAMQADVAIGSREAPGCQVTDSPRRRFIGRCFNRVARLLVPSGLADTQCGFKCFTARAAETVFRRLRLTGLAFDVEALYIARRHGLRIAEVPILWRADAETKVRFPADPLAMLVELAAIRRNAWRGLYR